VIKLSVLNEAGYREALLGLSLSYGKWDINTEGGLRRINKVSVKLSSEQGGHNKFLESICVWLDITTSLKVWKQLDTYRIGVTKQSESTMHTILKSELTQDMFASRVKVDYLEYLNLLREEKNLDKLTDALPSSFLQRRIVTTNYKAIQNIYNQRRAHRLPVWQEFCRLIIESVQHPEFIDGSYKPSNQEDRRASSDWPSEVRPNTGS